MTAVLCILGSKHIERLIEGIRRIISNMIYHSCIIYSLRPVWLLLYR